MSAKTGTSRTIVYIDLLALVVFSSRIYFLEGNNVEILQKITEAEAEEIGKLYSLLHKDDHHNFKLIFRKGYRRSYRRPSVKALQDTAGVSGSIGLDIWGSRSWKVHHGSAAGKRSR